MLTVAILINGHPIVAKNATNQSTQNLKGETEYKTDSGEIIWHDANEGAVELSHKLLDTIRNDEPKRRYDDGDFGTQEKRESGCYVIFRSTCRDCDGRMWFDLPLSYVCVSCAKTHAKDNSQREAWRKRR